MAQGRNEPCACGSGRKYKHCCGQAAGAPAAALPSADPAAAWALLQAGRPAEAEAASAALLARQPTLGAAWACLGVARQMQGKDGLAALETATTWLPDDAQVHYLLGQARAERRLPGPAAEAFQRAVALRPDFADAYNDLSDVQLQLGRTDAAIDSARRALALRPRFAAALGNLANAERASGRLGAAIAGYRALLALEPSLAEAHHSLGSALIEAGEPLAAVESLRRALALRPNASRTALQLARAQVQAGRPDEAIALYERELGTTPQPEILNDYAVLLSSLGRHEEAATRFREALARAPGSARLHANYAHALHCRGDFRGAIDAGQRALDLDPTLPEAYLNLGNALLALSEVHAAEQAYRTGLVHAPGHAALLTAVAMAERALGRLEAAEASATLALAANPAAADTLALLGNLAGDRGRFGEAEQRIRAALALAPDLPEALVGLTRVRRMTVADEAWRVAAEGVLARGLPVGHAITLHHAAGKYYDDVGEAAPAFRHHRAGNELARASGLRYDHAATSRRLDRVIASFDVAALAALRGAGVESTLPTLIVGMPRSGTTLAEQILASHPAVHGAGELLYWNFAADAEHAAAPSGRAALVGQLGRDYLQLLSGKSAEASRVVDKLPSNFENLGLVHAALPGARILHLERHPLDTCLSIYFQGFSTAHAYATDFGDLVHYYREYRRLMAHWHATLPAGTLLDVPYESLVEDPEGWTRRMLEHVGLPWDPRCLAFHQNDRPVLTASSWQVRQPIGRGAIDRWRRYESFIGPLMAALADAPARYRR